MRVHQHLSLLICICRERRPGDEATLHSDCVHIHVFTQIRILIDTNHNILLLHLICLLSSPMPGEHACMQSLCMSNIIRPL